MEQTNFFDDAAVFFGAMGHILYMYPEKEFYDRMIEESFFDEIPFGESANSAEGVRLLREWQKESKRGEYFGKLATDYQDLFIGTRGSLRTPPWESVYVSPEPILFGRSALDARLWYDRFGMKITKIGKEPDDHIGIELLFLSRLLSKKEYAEAAAFFKEHTGKWYAKFFRDVADNASTKFYRGAAIILYGACKSIEKAFAEVSVCA